MTFKLPSARLYFFSLFFALIVAGLLYWVLQAQALAINNLIILGLGLLIGHGFGVCSTDSPARQANAPKHPAAAHTDDASATTLSLYVGNLAYRVRRDELEALFAQYGTISGVRIMVDRDTRRPRGYAFVEMDAKGAREAISQLDDTEFCGRTLRVNEAKQKKSG